MAVTNKQINRILELKSAIKLGTALIVAISPLNALAGDLFEIQVYGPDVNRPLQPGLEVHTNFTVSGHREPTYAGEQPPHQVFRLTLEPALGITEYLEVGAYLQNMVNRDGQYRYAGWKLRTKWVIPERYTGNFFFGINAEIGKVPRAVEEHGWANEFRPIAGFYNGHWLFDINPIIGYALSGPDKLRPELEPAGKVGFNTQYGLMVGTEYYAGLGYLSAMPLRRAEQEHLLFLTVDLIERATEHPAAASANAPSDSESEPWEFNLGFGRGLTDATPQHWILKTIVGKAF